MGTERVDVVVIGAGLAGSAAAWALASRGRLVAVVEAFEPGHRRGSSHGSARIFRRAYPDPLYVRLTGQAQQRWRRLSDEAGEELILTTGAVDFGPAREQEKMYDILTALGVPAELIPAAAAAERWPGISFGADPVMFHPDGGLRAQGLVPFATAVPVTGEVNVLGRIVALLGRRPGWPR